MLMNSVAGPLLRREERWCKNKYLQFATNGALVPSTGPAPLGLPGQPEPITQLPLGHRAS